MHDAKGRELKVGSMVMVPCVVTSLTPGADYCNVSLTGVATMPPSHDSRISVTANTKQVIRAEEGDELTFTVQEDGKAVTIK